MSILKVIFFYEITKKLKFFLFFLPIYPFRRKILEKFFYLGYNNRVEQRKRLGEVISMKELEKIIRQTSETLQVEFSYYSEKSKPQNAPVCDKQFEGITDDGTYTYFRFSFKNNGY